jgi:hypothetical protein
VIRETILTLLADAEQRCAVGDIRIHEQMAFIAKLAQAGCQLVHAKATLRMLNQLQQEVVARRRSLLDALYESFETTEPMQRSTSHAPLRPQWACIALQRAHALQSVAIRCTAQLSSLDKPCKRLQCDESGRWCMRRRRTSRPRRPLPRARAMPGRGRRLTLTPNSLRRGGLARALAVLHMILCRLTTDGLKAYLEALEGAFGSNIDFAQLVKIYGSPATKGPERKYSPESFCGTKVMKVAGDPDGQHISTSYVSARTCALLPRSS